MKNSGLLLAVALLLSPTALLADNSDWRSWPLGERLKLSVGAYAADMDTEATVSTLEGPLAGLGTPLDFEDELGLDDSETAVFATLNWRMFKRHALNLNYYNLDRDGSAVSADGLVFDDILIPPGQEVNTTFDISVYELSYSYSFIFDISKNFYIGLGISAQDLSFNIASADIPALSADEDFVAPLPTLNLGFDYAISDKWLVGAKLGYMDIDASFSDDEFDAKLLIGEAGLRWKAFDNLGLGLYYSVFQLDGDYADDDIEAEVDLDYKGPRLSVDLYF